MRKRILIAFCLLLIAAMAVSTLAEETVSMTVTPAETTLKQGERVVITVSVAEFADCKSGSLRLEYDTNIFERSDNAWLLTGTIMADPNGDAVFAFSEAKPVSGNIYQFTLTAKETATLGDHAIAVKLQLKNTSGEISDARQAIKITVACAHGYGEWEKLNDDQHIQICGKCGDVVKENHAWDAGKTQVEATCAKEGLVIHTCTKCNATKEVITEKTKHTYDNACDTECNNGCGTTREPDHDYSTKWSSDGENHWHQCSVCGDKTDVLPHEPGDPATEWSAQKCKVCDHVLQPALGHTHNYETQWTKDDRGHWHTCKGCEDLKDYADHVYDNSCDTDCNTCGYVRTIQHTIDPNLWFDADGHWRECTVCGEKSRVEPHIPGPEATETSAQVCIDCGYELAPIVGHTHDYGYDWYFDDAGHWQQCGCGGTSVREAHTWNEGTVTKQPTPEMDGEKYFVCTVCDAEKRETIRWQGGQTPTTPTQPSVSDPEPQPKEFPWWVLVVAGGVLVLGFVVFMIVGAILGQKKTGKFSEK